MGSGTTIQDVNRLLTQFDQMKKMMRGLTGMGPAAQCPPLPGMPGGGGKHSGSNKSSNKNKRKPPPGFKLPFGRR